MVRSTLGAEGGDRVLAARVVRIGVGVAALAVVVQTSVHLANRVWFQTSELSADGEGNVWTWLSTATVIAIALVALVHALFLTGWRYRLVLLSGALVLFSVDDLIELHERGSLKVTLWLGLDGDYLRILWPALYLPLLVFVLAVLWQLAGQTLPPTSTAIRVGLLCLVTAVGVEAVWAGWHLTIGAKGDWPDTVEVAIEEALELGGWAAIASGMAAFALAEAVSRRNFASAMAVHDAPAEVKYRLTHWRRHTVYDAADEILQTGPRSVDGAQPTQKQASARRRSKPGRNVPTG